MSSLRSHFRGMHSHRSPTDIQDKKDSSQQRAAPSKILASEPAGPRQPSKLAKRASRSIPSTTTSKPTKAIATQMSQPEALSQGRKDMPREAISQVSPSSSAASATPQIGAQTLSPPPVLRTPSLVSGSSASTFDSPRSNVLRRKPSTIERYVARKRSEASGIELERSTIHSRADGYNDAMDDSVFGISMPTLTVNATYPDYVVPITSARPSTIDHQPDHSDRDFVGTSGIADLAQTQATNPTPTSSSEKRQSKQAARLASARPADEVRNSLQTKSSVKANRLPQLITSVSQSSTVTSRARTSVPNSNTTVKSGIPSKRTSRAVVNPPELAHLDVETPMSTVRPLPPRRPSRDGTPDMSSLTSQSPVILSDMKALPIASHKRPGSRESFGSMSSQGIRSRLGMSPKLTSKLSSPPIHSTPSPSNQDFGSALVKSGSSTSLSSETVKPRFGFLTRKSKSSPAKDVEKPKREPRKGPAAGTGHERYGKFGFRGRSGSISSSNAGRSPSTDSQASAATAAQKTRTSSIASNDASDLDDFLRDRLTPRVLRGSGSNFSAVTSPSMTSALDDAGDNVLLGFEYPRNDSELSINLVASSAPGQPGLRTTTGQARHDHVHAPIGSQNVYAFFELESAVEEQLPTSFNVSPPLADISNPSALGVTQKDTQPRPTSAGKKSSRKWNFLQRAQSAAKGMETAQRSISGAAQESRFQMFDNAADCALLDAVDAIDLKEAHMIASEHTKISINGKNKSQSKVPVAPYGETHRDLLPSPLENEQDTKQRTRTVSNRGPENAAMHAVIPGTMASRPAGNEVSPSEEQSSRTSTALPETLSTPDLTNGSESPRIPRLSPIGRIPKVVSKRDQERRLPDASFSRPFVSTQPRPPNAQPPGALYTKIRGVASPVESVQSPAEAFVRSPEHRAHQHSGSSGSNTHSAQNLFAFPSRQNSGFSCASSSDTTSMTAFSFMQPQNEDIWNEYDEFMDQVTPDSSYMPGFHYLPSISTEMSTFAPSYSSLYFGLPPTKEPSVALPAPPKTIRGGTPTSTTSQQSNIVTSPVQKRVSDVDSSNVPGSGLYQQIAAHLRVSPRSTFRDSLSSSRNSRISTHSRSASLPDGNVRSSHTSFASETPSDRRSQRRSKDVELGKELEPSVQLKLDLLMASKSLTFGRVLFSPAHNEMKFMDEPRVLVLDGLGSEWSHFVALSYPKATVYNLGPLKRQAKTQDDNKSRTNHRSINHPSIGAPFPFPRGFFTTAVLRFPVATSDQAYHACMSEIKRVLRPGGHLEVSVVDIDMSNMGDRARKAVRGLKTRMQQHEEDVSLRSLSDLLLQSIGRRGFESVQRCIIGVPITGRLPREHSGSVSSGSSGRLTRIDSNSTRRESKSVAQMAASMSSLHDRNVEETEDEKMTKTVARVGRWWYTTSYEKMLLKTDQSIWSDNSLLRECQAQGTSFKLLICCAQKPLQPRRRTASV